MSSEKIKLSTDGYKVEISDMTGNEKITYIAKDIVELRNKRNEVWNILFGCNPPPLE